MPNTKNHLKFKKVLLYFSSVITLVLTLSPLFAASASASSITQSYGAKTNLQPGIIVQLVPGDSAEVEPAAITNVKQAFGVVVNGADSTLSLSSSSATQQVFVVSSGNYGVFVSDQNGAISPGNYITVSNINGVGMKADSTQPIIVGQALQGFSSADNYVGTQSIKDSSGRAQTVHLGLIEVKISIAQNPLLKTQPTPLPAYLQKFSFYAVGKIVSPLRIYLGLSILIIILIITASMVITATRSSLISLGRNPLSKQVVTKGFLELIFIALIILISGVFGVYLLLKV